MRGLWRTDSWVRPYLRRYGRALALALALSVAASIFASALMFTSGFMISLAAAVPLTVLALHIPSLFVRIFGIGKPLLRYGERLSSHDWALRMTSEMRRRLYTVLERRATALGGDAERTTLGSVLALLNDDIGHVQNLILRSILPLASAWLLGIIVLIASGALSWQLFLIMLATLAVIAVGVPIMSAAANAARTQMAKEAQARIYDGLMDDVRGLADWVLSGRRDDYLHRLDAQLGAKARADAAIRASKRRGALISQVAFCLCAVAVLAWAAAAFCDGQGLSGALGAIAQSGSENAPAYPPNWIAAFILCLFPLMEALAPLPDAAIAYTSHAQALVRLNEQSAESDRAAGPADAASAKLPENPGITLTGVSFAYAPDAPLFEGFGLAIAPGERIAITGPSGAGKSTLAKLIHGDVRPTRGAVMIGDAPPSAYGNDIWRVVGVLQQAPKLFNMTLRENLRIGNEGATDEEMIGVLERVGLLPRFQKLDRGLDSIIAESAFNLSGGEAHRVALARILLADQPIVILDEPFAALDADTERAMLAAVMDALAGKTIIAITHNPATLSAFDRVVEL